jgi:dTDP-glucose 4,6-dehydratase
MRSLLITGGAGFIGSNFVHYWLQRHPDDRVTVLDALTYAGNLTSLQGLSGNDRLRIVHGNICDRELVERVLTEDGVDTVVHFAAESHVDRSIAEPDVFIRTNVLGTHCLLEAARKVWLQGDKVIPHRFHHVSTDEVYGSLGPNDPAFTEANSYAPNSPYAASKAASDHLVRAYHHTYGLCTTLSNCSNNYGPYHFPEKLIPLAIVNILHGKPLPLYGDGRNVRDWLHVSDHCRGIDLILGGASPGAVYNIGGRAESENLHLLRLLCNVADEALGEQPELRSRFPDCPAARGDPTASLITFVRDRPGHDRRYAIDCTRIEKDLGFGASVSLEAGLRATFAWYVSNEAWWRSVMDGSYRNWVETHYGQATGSRPQVNDCKHES